MWHLPCHRIGVHLILSYNYKNISIEYMARRNKTSKKRSVRRRSGRKTQRRVQKQRGGKTCTKDGDCDEGHGGFCRNGECQYSGSPFI